MTSLSGTWRAAAGPATMVIEGRDPAFAFRAEAFGTPVSSGVVSRQPDGTYFATGQGVGGPVSMRVWLADENTLQLQAALRVDGGMVDEWLKMLAPQPVETYLRVVPQVVLPPRPETPVHAPGATAEDTRRHDEARRRRDRERLEQHRRKQERKQEARGRQEAKESKEAKKPKDEDPMKELRALVGMGEVKQELENLEAWAWRQAHMKEQGLAAEAPSMHMSFAGGPGTGKTTVARIVGKLLKSHGLLEHGKLKEVRRADLVGQFVGQTAPKTEQAIADALGGVLFIDEAYALSEAGAGGGTLDYGVEALTALIAGMENHRAVLCVIVAGYPEEMARFIDANAGLASRISRHVVFADYTEAELQEIFVAMAAKQELVLAPAILETFEARARRAKAAAKPRQWGNARWVRNVLERGIEQQALRLRKLDRKPTREQLQRLEASDFAFLAA